MVTITIIKRILALLGVVAWLTADCVAHLPTTLAPLNYMLRLQPDLDNNTVSGIVIIELITATNQSEVNSMNSITLHLGVDSEINLANTLLVDSVGVFVKNLSLVYHDDNTTVEVVLPSGKTLTPNRVYMLSLPFTSPLYSEPCGLFSGYFNSASKYLASNFRATHARDVFPCFDEPRFQVPLTLQVLRPASYNVAFTTALYSSVAMDNDTVLDTFEPTASLSLSSLGLFMSQVTPVKAMGLTLYAPDNYNTSVSYLEDLLSIIHNTLGTFPTPNTLNLIILPDHIYESFSSFGFVFTTPEVYNGEVRSELRWLALRQQLAEAFLQQYLAFTKTPSWWSDLWLSDSLAAFLAIQMLPQPSLEGLQRTEIRSRGLNSDYNWSCSGPVVNNQLLARMDIESAILNQTIKNKGLSILTMWQDSLPEGLLNQTVFDFINLNKSLTNTEDFLQLLVLNIKSSNISNEISVTDNIYNWLYAYGNPLVTLSSQSTSDFSISQSSDCSNLTSSVWVISISYTNESSTNWVNFRQDHWLLNDTLSLSTNGSDWLVLNLENAPYIVNYDSSYKQILAALTAENSSSIPTAVRASLQADAVALALAGSLDFDTALSVLNNTQHDQVDWLPVASALDTFTALIGTAELALNEFGIYVETLFSASVLSALDLRNSYNNTGQWLARTLLTPWLCYFNISSCRTDVLQLNQLLLQQDFNDQIDSNDVDNVACLGARYNLSVLQYLLDGYTNTTDLAYKRLFTLGLGCIVDASSVQKLLSIISESLSSSQSRDLLRAGQGSMFSGRDLRDILVGLASSVENSGALVDFIVSDATTIQAAIGSGYLSDIVKTLSKFRVDLSKLESLTYANVNLDSYIKQSIVEAVSKVNYSFTWWSSYGSSFLNSLPQLSSTTNPSTESTSTSTEPTNPAISSSTTMDTTTDGTPSSASQFTKKQLNSLSMCSILLVMVLVCGFNWI